MAKLKNILGFLLLAFIVLAVAVGLIKSFYYYGLWTIFYVLESMLLLMCFYVFFSVFLFVVGAWFIKRMFNVPLPDAGTKKNYITIVVPAHNEGRLLPKLLKSFDKQTYSKEYWQAVIVADNCQDNTAELAAASSYHCLPRFTSVPSNKQQALQHGMSTHQFSQEFENGFICIIDADCELDEDYLEQINRQLVARGNVMAMQSNRYVKNKHDSDVTTLDAAAEALRNWVICAPRKWLGLSVFINGSGVLFNKTLFDTLLNMSGHSLAEDKFWKSYLSKSNIYIDYCSRAKLSYEAVTLQKDFQKQRQRWIGSQLDMINQYGWKALFHSILHLNLSEFDFFCSLVQLPRSFLFLSSLLFFLLGWMVPATTFIPFYYWLLIVIGLILYGALGLFLVKARKEQYASLFAGFNMVIGIVNTTFKSFMGRGLSKWSATREIHNE